MLECLPLHVFSVRRMLGLQLGEPAMVHGGTHPNLAVGCLGVVL